MTNMMNVPITAERPWMVFAACRGADPDLFFDGDDHDPRPALAICSTCTVRAECLDFAFEARLTEGIWGGMTSKQRRRAMRRSIG